jgi:hypothetical protein
MHFKERVGCFHFSALHWSSFDANKASIMILAMVLPSFTIYWRMRHGMDFKRFLSNTDMSFAIMIPIYSCKF